MKPLFALFVVLSATSAFAQSAAEVCQGLLMGSERARCIATIAGHVVEPGAARVCQSALMDAERIACLSGALDKRYGADELAACASVLMGMDKAHCLAGGGTRVEAREPRRRHRRERAADDDDDDDAPRARLVTATLENRSRRLTADRYYWRLSGRGEWVLWTEPHLGAGDSVDLAVQPGRYDVCVETSDGRRGRWTAIRVGDAGYRFWFDARSLEEGDCSALR
jgi:hypothetical protein